MTSNNANINANSLTAGSTSRSPASSATTKISPTWAPPKSPLSPHRLAKLANALGVSTPMPATPQSMSYMSRSFLESPTTPDAFRQSPIPSTAGTNAYSPTVSKYLLHIIPPMHLPHDTDNDMTPPPVSASGYHTQFRRGTLVPVHSNMQSQLAAIAKEYALPSTAGIILYLVSSAKRHQFSPTPEGLPDEMDEPGPRLSEDIWRHLWTRVSKAEQRDDILMPPLRSPLGMSLGTRSTPYLPQDSNSQPFRPFLSSALETVPPNLSFPHLPPTPTTPSTFSDLRSNTRSAPPSETSVNDPETPETSFTAPSIVKDPETRANSLDLPGLASPSIIPILAKVEFDIDRRKATWYEPWLRSRRLNHAKRTESRNGRQEDTGDNFDGPYEYPRHIDLLTGNKEAQSTVSVALSSTEGVLTMEPNAMLVPLPTLEDDQLDEQEDDQDEGGGWSEEVLTGESNAMLISLPTSEGYQEMEKQQEDQDEGSEWSEEVLIAEPDPMPIPRPTSKGYHYNDEQQDRNEGGGWSEGVLAVEPDALPLPLPSLDEYQHTDEQEEDRDGDDGWSEGDLTMKPGAIPGPLPTLEGYEQLDEQEDDQDEAGGWSERVLTVELEAPSISLPSLERYQQHDAQEEEYQNEGGGWSKGVLADEPEMSVPLPTSEGGEQEEDQDKGGGWSDNSGDDEFKYTARVAMTLENHEDALADVFGTDAETWAEMKIYSMSKHQTNPNIVDLAINAADLTALPSPTDSDVETLGKEEDEVQALLDQMARPSLSVSLPTLLCETKSSLPVPGNKKHVPPPLTFVTNSPPRDLAVPTDSTPSSASSGGLAYLYDGDTSPGEEQGEEFEADYMSPGESIKRGGVMFDDLDLGLDPTEDYDETDPNDRRHSQFLMMAQLDEIERTMAQLSPRVLQDDFADEQHKESPSNSMRTLSGKLNADFFPPSPRFLQHDEVPDSPLLKPETAWPATPLSIKNVPSSHQDVRTAPRLAITASIPNTPGEISEESQLRKRELEEEEDHHRRPVLPPKPPIVADSGPIIPLSPDPFGRFSSTPPPLPGEQQSSAYWEKDAVPDISNISPVDISLPMDFNSDRRKRSNSSATSRFSADSITGIEANSKSNRSTLMSVNTFRKLWKKNTKNVSSSKLPPIPSGSSIPAVPPLPSLDKSDETPKTPILGRFPSPPPRQSRDMLPPPVPQAPPQQLLVPVMAQQSRSISQSQSQLPQPPPKEELAPPVPPKPRSLLPHPQQQPSPSPSQQWPPIHHPSQKFQYPLPPQQEVTISQQSPVPPLFNGTSMNPQPIVAAQMCPGRRNSSLDRFQFDQESPYPLTTRRTRVNSRPLSPPIASPNSPTTNLSPLTPTTASGNFSPMSSPALPVRKSILKSSKSLSVSSTASIPQLVGLSEPGANIERSNSNGTRPRHHSVLSIGSSRTSVTSLPPDIPPSPQIPQQFIPRNDKRQSIRSRLTNLSIDSSHSTPQLSIKTNGSTSRRSMTSSYSSQESRPSFDVSQFEMVSPKIDPAMAYPYHRSNHSMGSSIEERK